jgi:hypothetical protein
MAYYPGAELRSMCILNEHGNEDAQGIAGQEHQILRSCRRRKRAREYRTFKRHIRPSGEKSPAVTSVNGKSELRLGSFLQTNKSINGLGEARQSGNRLISAKLLLVSDQIRTLLYHIE